jgi:hypothetical protein
MAAANAIGDSAPSILAMVGDANCSEINFNMPKL